MLKEKINPEGSAEKTGKYSHGMKITIGDAELIFVTGQIAMDENGNVISENVTEQTEYVFQSIQKILNAAGSSLDDVVKASVFVTNMDDFKEISQVRNKYFAKSKPVSTLVEVNKMVKDGIKVEIEVIAVKQK